MSSPDNTSIPDGYKCCSRCKKIKSCSEFHKSSKSKGGLKGECKVCRSLSGAARYAANPEYWSKYNADHREHIRQQKSQYNALHREEIAARKAKYNREHRAEISRRRAKHYAENREKERQRSIKYQNEHREELSRKNAERYRANREKERQKNAERYIAHRADRIERSNAYYHKNQEQCRARNLRHYRQHKPVYILSSLRRRARKRSLPDAFSVEDKLFALDYFHYCCAACGRPQGFWHTLAMDHWIPLSNPDCPGTVPENMVPLCHGIGGCNNTKHDKNPEEWLAKYFSKRKAREIARRVQEFFETRKANK